MRGGVHAGEGTGAGAEEAAAEAVEAAPARRAAGPAMPPRELLEAAAAAAAAMEALGPEQERWDWDDVDMVGPPPPEMVEEVDAAADNERDAEVC